MKIIATIADDRKPQGWQETYNAPTHAPTEEEARQHLEAIVATFNASLRPGELPRRLLSITLEEHSAEEARALGYHAGSNFIPYHKCPWPQGHPLRADWLAGWYDAEDED